MNLEAATRLANVLSDLASMGSCDLARSLDQVLRDVGDLVAELKQFALF